MGKENHVSGIKLVPIEEIQFHPKNRNAHSKDQLERLAKILKYQGIRRPGTVSNLSGYLTVGEGRVRAAKLAGFKEYPISFQDYEDEAQEISDLNADNAIGLWADLDLKGIGEDILDFGPGFDIELLGIENFTIDPSEKYGDKDPDAVPEPPKEPITKTGDLWILGNHRLLCGDCTVKENVDRLMNGEKADMVFTDPPYGISYRSNAWDSEQQSVQARKTNAEITGDKSTDVGSVAISMLSAHLGESVHSYVWCRWDCFGEFLKAASALGKVKGVVVWDKGGPGLGDLECSYGDSEWAIHSLKGRRPLAERQNGVWQVNRMKGLQMKHPTQKPVELAERAIINSSENRHIVVDPFLGSGSTLIACEQTNRRCFGTEIDPAYCDVIVKRWEEFTGNKAERA